MQVIGFVIYLGLGFLQFFATLAGLEEWIGLHWLIATPGAFIIAYIPIIGTIIGMLGAVEVWGWSWLSATLLFFGPFLLMVGFGVVAGGIDALFSKDNR